MTDLQQLALGHPILLWLTDRSRYETGNKCPRNRLLEYHWGPHGYGIRKLATKIPLATGDVIHRGLKRVLEYVRINDCLPITHVLDDATREALDAYRQIIDTRGLLHWHESTEQQERLVREQQLLIEGLVRAWTLWRLPEVLRDWRVVHVEEEHVSVLDCTCGLGDRVGDLADHVAKSCEGIAIQTRADFVAEHRVARETYSYHEFKSTRRNDARFREEYETTMQPSLGTLGIEDALGIDVTQIFIHGLIKGEYDHEYNPATRLYDGPEFQNSRLVYAWRNEAQPMAPEWAVKYQWTDEGGVGHRLPKSFKRAFVDEFGPMKEYLELFAEDLRPQILHTLGPLPKKDHIRQGALESWRHTERQIRWALHEFVDLVEQHGGWSAPEVQRFLDREFPRTFDCQRYGGRYKCHYIPVCHEHPGWEDPQGLFGFVQRRPHHAPELDQAVERGLLPPLVPVDETDEL